MSQNMSRPKALALKAALPLVGLGLLIAFGFQNCTALPDSTTDSSSLDSTTAVATTGLSLTQSGTTMATAATLALTAYGGTAPYTYSLYSGPGSLSGSIYTSTTAGSVIIRVQDAVSSNAYFNLYVVGGSGSTTTTTTTTTTGLTKPVYRYYNSLNGLHAYSITAGDSTLSAYTSEGNPFQVLATAASSGSQPLYRCYWASYGSYFISVDYYCSGSTNQGTIGYVYNSQVSGTVPLYTFYLSSSHDFFVTTDYNEGNNAGYATQGLLGYVFITAQ